VHTVLHVRYSRAFRRYMSSCCENGHFQLVFIFFFKLAADEYAQELHLRLPRGGSRALA